MNRVMPQITAPCMMALINKQHLARREEERRKRYAMSHECSINDVNRKLIYFARSLVIAIKCLYIMSLVIDGVFAHVS